MTPDQEALIRQAIKAGRFEREEDAAQEAVSLWADRERRRLEILAAVERAEESLARGEGRSVTTPEEVSDLVRDVKRRGLARLAVEKDAR